MTPKKIVFHIFYFNSNGSYQISSIFDMYIDINERVDVNQDGPRLIIETAPPPGPKLAKYVNVFTYEKLIINCFPCICRQCDEVFMTLRG